MNPRTAALLAAAMIGTLPDVVTLARRARAERMFPSIPTSTREKQAKNKYRRRKGKR